MVVPVARPVSMTVGPMEARTVELMAALTVVPRVRPMVVPVARPVSTTAALMVARTVALMVALMVALTVAQTGLLATDA